MSNDARSPSDTSGSGTAPQGAPAHWPRHLPLPVVVFTATTFLSALLLFSIQPLFAKMVLPLLGGSPSVWAVALCFFQGALLAGYCYAHLVNHYVPVRWAGAVHLALLISAMLSLPIGLPGGWREPPPGDPYLWQLGLFSMAIGLPFLAVSANAPLLQAWFARTGHPDGRDPYFLYAASNLGSFVALLAYPLVLEPAFGVGALSRLWTIGFALLWLAIAICILLVRQAPATAETTIAQSQAADERAPSLRDRLAWIGLAMVPSGLLTAYTSHITTDVASAPLIWVIPLSLYLLTFVVVFREHAMLPRSLMLRLHIVSVIATLVVLSQTAVGGWLLSAAVGVAAFFLSGLVAHRTLYEARPPARHLTQFYLYMSLGGVLGGLFAALIAPQLFSEVLEYPLLLALTMACRPGALDLDIRNRQDAQRLALVLGCALMLVLVAWLLDAQGWLDRASRSVTADAGWAGGIAATLLVWLSSYGVAAILALGFVGLVWHYRASPARQLAAAFLVCAAVVVLPSAVRRGAAERSFFGVYRVSTTIDSEFNILSHGTTVHGAQRMRDAKGNPVTDTTPGTYYHPKGPMAVALRLARDRLTELGQTAGRYGIVGLGAGSLACYARPGEMWRFYEIDPLVVRIAKDTRIFTFLSTCLPKSDIILGDARLTLAREKPQTFDVLIIDAFSSDAVPVHLLTVEALRMYLDKLTPDGVLVLHISNRYLDLDGVVAATMALIPGLDGVLMEDDEDDGTHATAASTVAVLSMSKAALASIRTHDHSAEFEATALRGWTDDYSDILGPFIAKQRQQDHDEDE